MLEEDQFICKHCEKTIRYERPLFCPFCGKKIDPTDGLELKDNEIKIYKFSGIAPFLIKLLMLFCVLIFPISWVLGRTGVVAAVVLFSVISIGSILVAMFVTKK